MTKYKINNNFQHQKNLILYWCYNLPTSKIQSIRNAIFTTVKTYCRCSSCTLCYTLAEPLNCETHKSVYACYSVINMLK